MHVCESMHVCIDVQMHTRTHHIHTCIHYHHSHHVYVCMYVCVCMSYHQITQLSTKFKSECGLTCLTVNAREHGCEEFEP